MAQSLRVSAGTHSDKGPKAENQDAVCICLPAEPLLTTKGISLLVADGVSSSKVGHLASLWAVQGFEQDYYATSEALGVKTSALEALAAINGRLLAHSLRSEHRYERDKGYVCTLAGLILKGHTGHVLHAGDSRVYLFRNGDLVQLTRDHRVQLGEGPSMLDRALGMQPGVEIEYSAVSLLEGDVFMVCTDGISDTFDAETLRCNLLLAIDSLGVCKEAAQMLAEMAKEAGASDNLTLGIVRIDALPDQVEATVYADMLALPCAPLLREGQQFEHYEVVRALHHSARSHVYLAIDTITRQKVVLKVPSMDMRDGEAYLSRFVMEEWLARRMDNPHLMKAAPKGPAREHLYVAMEYLQGITLEQWMRDNPRPSVEQVRGIIEQVGRGLQAMHRLETLHQDLRPHNIMIDEAGTVKLIDFGAAQVFGLLEAVPPGVEIPILGTAQYTAPEYFLGDVGRPNSDLFSLAVITYQMLCGRLPYGTAMSRSQTRAAQRKLVYESILEDDRHVPRWLDATLEKALHVDPNYRYQELSEFLHDLRYPNLALTRQRQSLLDKDPLRFWKTLSLILSLSLLLSLLTRHW